MDDSYWVNNTKKRSACYKIRSMYSFSDTTTFKMIYFAQFHSIMEYGITLWVNLLHSRKVHQLQKKIITTMRMSKPWGSHKVLLQTLQILTLPSRYILSLMTFLMHNFRYFTFNSSSHSINTRKNYSYIDH